MESKFELVASIEETGKLGICYLKRIWSCTTTDMRGMPESTSLTKYTYVTAVFNCLGIGIEPTFEYLFQESPTFEEFEDWIIENGKISEEMIEMFNSALLDGSVHRSEIESEDFVLNEAMLNHWDEHGYVILKNAISKEDCAKTVKIISDVLEIDLEDQSTWYNNHDLKQGIMVQVFHNEQLNSNRLNKRIHSAFSQLWKRNDLIVSFDRVSFNPPETDSYHFPGPDLHWDVSLKTPIPFGTQGLLYLTDTEENQGAFTLVPGFQNKIEEWLKSLPNGTNPREEDLHKLGAKAIGAEVGDLIIWHQALPHGSSPNSSTKPRIVQYINYLPLEREIHEEWI